MAFWRANSTGHHVNGRTFDTYAARINDNSPEGHQIVRLRRGVDTSAVGTVSERVTYASDT